MDSEIGQAEADDKRDWLEDGAAKALADLEPDQQLNPFEEYMWAVLHSLPAYTDGHFDFDLYMRGVLPWISDMMDGCHAGQDGDCNGDHCPQEFQNRKFYQEWCPLARTSSER